MGGRLMTTIPRCLGRVVWRHKVRCCCTWGVRLQKMYFTIRFNLDMIPVEFLSAFKIACIELVNITVCHFYSAPVHSVIYNCFSCISNLRKLGKFQFSNFCDQHQFKTAGAYSTGKNMKLDKEGVTDW